jgi:hypothetical protein
MKMTTKARLNIKAFNLFKEIVLERANYKCEICGGQANTAHHYYPQSSYGYLKYETKGGISICVKCHFKHHTKADPIIHEIAYRKRKKDLDELKKIKRPTGTYITVKWIKDSIEELKKELWIIFNEDI